MHQESSGDLDCARCDTEIIDAMLEAAKKGQNEVVERCLERDSTTDCLFHEDTDGSTVLKYVLYNDHVRALEMMFNRHRQRFTVLKDFMLTIAAHKCAMNSVDFLLARFEFSKMELQLVFAIAIRQHFEGLVNRLLLQKHFLATPSNVVEIFNENMVGCLPLLVASGAVYNTACPYFGLPIIQHANTAEMIVAFIVHCGTPVFYQNYRSHRVIAPHSYQVLLAYDAIFHPKGIQTEDDVADFRFRAYFQTALLDRLLFSLLCHERNPNFPKVKKI